MIEEEGGEAGGPGRGEEDVMYEMQRGMLLLTFWIKLQDMNVAISVRGDEVQLFPIGQEVSREDFDGVR